jgi:hypothetical protein
MYFTSTLKNGISLIFFKKWKEFPCKVPSVYLRGATRWLIRPESGYNNNMKSHGENWKRPNNPMNRFTPFFLFFLLLGGVADGKNLEATKRAGDYQVEIVMDRNPPIAIGDNNIEIEIRDKAGKRVTDAQVIVNYYMPPMPRMAPMSYKTEAKMKKGKYHAAMKFIMAGPWYIAIIIHHDGKISTAKINVDAQ